MQDIGTPRVAPPPARKGYKEMPDIPPYTKGSENWETGPEHICFTQETNALDFLVRCGEFIERVTRGDDPRLWKWVVISLHGALYGFAISACRGTSNIRVTHVPKKGQRKGKPALIDFWKALKLCQNKTWMSMTSVSQPLKLTPRQKDAIAFLKVYWRNELEHFTPSTHSFGLIGVPEAVSETLDVVKFLALHTRTFLHLSKEQEELVAATVERSKTALQSHALFGKWKPKAK